MQSPLADRIRPKTLDEMVGQPHLIGKGRALRNIIESGNIPNLIFYGPSGTGKTTLASIIAAKTDRKLCRLNCTNASTSDIKDVISQIGTLAAPGGILLYLDEIQYFTKKQQQSLLEMVENGGITLIASTTENPYFYIYNALLSRCSVFEFKPVTPSDVKPAIDRAFEILSGQSGRKVELSNTARDKIADACGGDVRKAVGICEMAMLSCPVGENPAVISPELVAELTQNSAQRYDRTGDEHYDSISALHKSLRGSDPDAAVHYLSKILLAGDMPSACRRLMCAACEDVGLAYPQIIPVVKSAVDMALQLGMPEARLPLANAAILIALSPKSNSAYLAVSAAERDIQNGKAGPVPRCLQNKHFDGEDAQKKGQGYLYPHDYENHYVKQQYLPDSLADVRYYTPGDNKNEQAFYDNLKKRRGEK